MIHDGRSETPAVVWWVWLGAILMIWLVIPFVKAYVAHLRKLREDERAIRAAVEKLAAEQGFEVRWKEFKWRKVSSLRG